MRQFMEKRIVKDREAAEKTAGITRMLKDNTIMIGHGKSEKRVEALRRKREEEQRQLEFQHDHQIVQAAQEKEAKATLTEMEENIAQELEKRNATKIRTDMNRRRICEGSDELKDLKIKLQAAEMNKLQKSQRLQRLVNEQEEVKYDREIAAEMEVRRQAANIAAEKVEVKKAECRLKAKDTNLQQIADRSGVLAEEAHKQLMKDKSQVQAIVDKIHREDMDAEAHKQQKRVETQAVIVQFREENERMRKERKERDQEENRVIEEYARQKVEFEEKLEAEKKAVEEKKKAQLALMLGAQEEKDRMAAELEYLRNELHQEELEDLNRRREEMKLRKKLEDRVEMHKAYEQQMVLKSQRREDEYSKEAEFRTRLMAKFAEDDRVEQLNDQKRRMKMSEHKREVTRLWDEKMRILNEEAARDKAALEAERKEEQERLAIIEDERQRLLRTFAVPLKDHLPKGVFEEDQDHMNIMGRLPKKD